MRSHRNGFWALALAMGTSIAHAAHAPDPVVLTVDGRNYVTYGEFSYNATDHLVVAFDALMRNCRRSGGEMPQAGPLRFLYTVDNTGFDLATLQITFAPTRAVMTTPGGDMICDGEANAGQTGLGRIFRSDFEPD